MQTVAHNSALIFSVQVEQAYAHVKNLCVSGSRSVSFDYLVT